MDLGLSGEEGWLVVSFVWSKCGSGAKKLTDKESQPQCPSTHNNPALTTPGASRPCEVTMRLSNPREG